MQRFGVEVRASLSGNTLVGHAAVFGQVAKLSSHYERLDPSAFDDALTTSDVRFLLNHDPSKLLGRQSSGTLRLERDDKGLAFEVDLPDTQDGHDVRELVRRGDLDGGSIGFLPGSDAWTRAKDGVQVRTHTRVKQLIDASIVTFPAYAGTDVALRSLDVDLSPSSNRSRLIRARARVLADVR